MTATRRSARDSSVQGASRYPMALVRTSKAGMSGPFPGKVSNMSPG
jgi:hypothetical protein